jgi:hypothetical protein
MIETSTPPCGAELLHCTSIGAAYRWSNWKRQRVHELLPSIPRWLQRRPLSCVSTRTGAFAARVLRRLLSA